MMQTMLDHKLATMKAASATNRQDRTARQAGQTNRQNRTATPPGRTGQPATHTHTDSATWLLNVKLH